MINLFLIIIIVNQVIILIVFLVLRSDINWINPEQDFFPLAMTDMNWVTLNLKQHRRCDFDDQHSILINLNR